MRHLLRSVLAGAVLFAATLTHAKTLIYAGSLIDGRTDTVRDLGARDNLNTALRDAVAKGWVVGPRIFSVGKALPPPAVMVTPPTGSRKSTAVIPARKKA